MGRIRWIAGAGLAALAAAGGASAQDTLPELRALNAAQQGAEIARQDALAAQREITARQDQLQTALVLRELDAARTAPPGSNGLIIPPPAPAPPPASGPESFQGQMDRLERLTQDALARSNARVLAVRPASDR
ncbi:hypothetical protein ACN2C7_13830 [Caulobacter sp. ErkDOM-E]|uniref:hypothetical protein n=1 Tax=Caulobacter sp. ErkDOM-E TaxID=3402778 RepID=UPI003AF9A99A